MRRITPTPLLLLAAFLAVDILFTLIGSAVAADDILVTDAYARILPGAKAGAVYLVIDNAGKSEDALIGASTPVAAMAGLHTTTTDANGMMQMGEAEAIPLPPGAHHTLSSGGDHVMLMGFTGTPPAPGTTFPLTLTFRSAGEMKVEVTVDNDRK